MHTRVHTHTHTHTHTQKYTEWGLGYIHSSAGVSVLLLGQPGPGKTSPTPHKDCTQSSGWGEVVMASCRAEVES